MDQLYKTKEFGFASENVQIEMGKVSGGNPWKAQFWQRNKRKMCFHWKINNFSDDKNQWYELYNIVKIFY